MSEPLAWRPAYSIRPTPRANRPGTWNSQDVEVLDWAGAVVGTYTYNYSMTPPFFAFELGDQWYALYARDYTASRIMKLPSCGDVWGEEPSSHGFCPVEFYVPAEQVTTFGGDRTNKLSGTSDSDPKSFQVPHYDEKNDWTIEPVKFAAFGFSCGCIWGDDSSWKVRFFDLSKLSEGIVVYDERFGYAEMSQHLSLAQSVQVNWPHAKDVRVTLFTAHDYHLDGKRWKEE